MEKNKIFITEEYTDEDVDVEKLEKIVEKILEKLGLENVEISVLLVDNDEIRKLNKEWRGKDKPTDVLSFPIDEETPYGCKLLGDIVISVPYAKEHAKEFGNTFQEEMVRLLAHGILHLLGYDHEKSKEEAEIMFEKENELISSIKNEL
jgi:probable rRNA maturation factor